MMTHFCRPIYSYSKCEKDISLQLLFPFLTLFLNIRQAEGQIIKADDSGVPIARAHLVERQR